mmetsp:Transcript_10270/g.21994  ORF Transcript_10270/g.21994 Transcript_10270/m.21994 type:complete len:132 (+) Transcript_10270:1038-1433(+)
MTNKQTIKQGRNLYPYPNNNNNNNKDTNSTNNTTITKRPWKTEQMNRVASRRVLCSLSRSHSTDSILTIEEFHRERIALRCTVVRPDPTKSLVNRRIAATMVLVNRGSCTIEHSTSHRSGFVILFQKEKLE